MPQTTPNQKIRKTKKFGGKYITVELVGDTFDEAYRAAIAFSNQTGSIFVHPFNDPLVIEGQ
jgi:threonine dehydratase